jgi:hypothetical protein
MFKSATKFRQLFRHGLLRGKRKLVARGCGLMSTRELPPSLRGWTGRPARGWALQ